MLFARKHINKKIEGKRKQNDKKHEQKKISGTSNIHLYDVLCYDMG